MRVKMAAIQNLLGIIDLSLQTDNTTLSETVAPFSVQEITEIIEKCGELKTIMPDLESALAALLVSRIALNSLSKKHTIKPASMSASVSASVSASDPQKWQCVVSQPRIKTNYTKERCLKSICTIETFPGTCQRLCKFGPDCTAISCKFIHTDTLFVTHVQSNNTKCSNCAGKNTGCWSHK